VTPAAERRALQCVAALLVLVPVTTAGVSLMRGAAWLAQGDAAPDLDSHFRYLSGIFLALGIAFATCIPGIERKGARFRLLGALVVAGGIGRLISLIAIGAPSTPHLAGLAIELGAVPLLMLWQARIAARYRLPSSPGPTSAVGR
jgi:hypothetical protein